MSMCDANIDFVKLFLFDYVNFQSNVICNGRNEKHWILEYAIQISKRITPYNNHLWARALLFTAAANAEINKRTTQWSINENWKISVFIYLLIKHFFGGEKKLHDKDCLERIPISWKNNKWRRTQLQETENRWMRAREIVRENTRKL